MRLARSVAGAVHAQLNLWSHPAGHAAQHNPPLPSPRSATAQEWLICAPPPACTPLPEAAPTRRYAPEVSGCDLVMCPRSVTIAFPALVVPGQTMTDTMLTKLSPPGKSISVLAVLQMGDGRVP